VRTQSRPPDGGVPRESAKELGLAPRNSICAIHGSPCLLDMMVRVGACLTQTMDVITADDSGVGIPEDDWGLLFEGFYQVQEPAV
jgi:signal transduction histidine kinase